MATSRQHAQELIADRRVTVGGASTTKATRQVSPAEPLLVRGPPARFVGRGAQKLEGALNAFKINVSGRHGLDVGSSTGGFTDCLLQAGAASVVAVDVGTNQLHERLRANPRVDVRESTDIRTITPDLFVDDSLRSGGFGVIVADLSFISTTSLLPVLAPLLAPDGDVIVLVKPQFEAGRQEVSKGRGIIRNPEIWKRVLHDFIHRAVDAGLEVVDLATSPITGGKGNVEFLAHLRLTDILTDVTPEEEKNP
ncbi:MAG: 23S rRNA (cytidine1920-2'-O)/16S rRNA (cytidine1409-2'-O)-methyltransferase [Verrucomicrobiales bacterium]